MFRTRTNNINNMEMIIVKCLKGNLTHEEKKELAIFFEENTEALWQAALLNRVDPIVAHSLSSIVGIDNIPLSWRQSHENNHARILSYITELKRLAEIFHENNIPMIALKNSGLVCDSRACPGCSPMGDVDVLIDKTKFRKAHQLLLEEGFHFEYRSPLEEAELVTAECSGGSEYWRILPNNEKMWLELQWRPVAGRWIRPDQEPSADELIERSIVVIDTKIRVLCPEDNLLQVSLHTAKHTYMRGIGIRLHTDVERIVHRESINWDQFLFNVRRLKVKTAVYFSLAIPKTLFDTPIPDEVLDALRPRRWKVKFMSSWIYRVGLFNPDERKFGRIGYILFNALLYDDIAGLVRGIFPEKEWMMTTYNLKNAALLPYYYVKRIFTLTVKRLRT